MFTKLKQKTLEDSKPKPTVQKNGEKNGERLGKEETVDQVITWRALIGFQYLAIVFIL